ncbi:Hypothetical protein GLP15_701 [Giardia lamblia P15]|uniref:Uncharacterized protein n=1 Tax=Giardia intestinalis (strain P15) TaxID=658858 RepID=E1F432_GIAIA|nr:Hypothetical protein GLP15_701 [Giardia lamblia P15]
MSTYTSLNASFGSSTGTRMTAFPNSAEMIETAVPHATERRLSSGSGTLHDFHDKVFTQNMTSPSNLIGSGRFVTSRVGDPTSYGLARDFFSFDSHKLPDVKTSGGSLSSSLSSSRNVKEPMPLMTQTAETLAMVGSCHSKPIYTVYDKGTSRVFGPGNETMFARDKIFTGVVSYPMRPSPKWSFRSSDYPTDDKVIPPFIGDTETGRYARAGRLSSSDIIKPSSYETYGTSSEAVYVPPVARYGSVLPVSVTRTTSTGLRSSSSSFSSRVAPIAAALDNLGASFSKMGRGSSMGSRSLSVSTAPGTMRISRNYTLDSLANVSVY